MAVLLVSTACDRTVKVEPVGRPTSAVESTSCSTYGFCYTCDVGMGVDGYKYSCNFKYSHNCPGTQQALVTRQLHKILYESGKTRVMNRVVSTRAIGECT